MTLRARMGIAAGAAVALAVIAVAVSAYAGTRSQLRSQLDKSLQSLAGPVESHAGGPGGGGNPGAGDPYAAGGAPVMHNPRGAAANGGGAASGTSRKGTARARGKRTAVQSLFQPIGSPGGSNLPRTCDENAAEIGLLTAPGQGAAPGVKAFITKSGQGCQVSTGTSLKAAEKLPVTSRAKALAKSGNGQYYTDVTVDGTPFRMLVVGLHGLGAVEVALSLSDVNSTLSSELLLLILIAAGGIALAALLGIFVARTAVGPIARFTSQAERIAAHPDRVENERLEVSGNDELARLGRTFNATLDALESSIAAQRNLVADASHELRTPIATIRANLQLMRDEQLLSPEDRAALRSDMIEELDELTKLVSDVVELARGAKPSAEPNELRLDEIIGAALDRARRRSPQLTFTAELDPTLISGDGARVERAVTNLLDNAGKYAPDGGTVEVALRGGVVTVRDHGPGFHDEDLPFVFDRFHRARDARSKPGSGLGLAIVRQAAQSHGGFVEAANADGGGALMRISFGEPLELERRREPLGAS